jgi:amidase
MDSDDESQSFTNIETDEYLLVDEDVRLQPDVPQIFHVPKLNGHDMFEITVDELQNFFSTKAFTSEEYTKYCLDRIQVTNPYLEAVIETNPDALRIARELDHERESGSPRGPLHGVPVLVKDVGIAFSPHASHTSCQR